MCRRSGWAVIAIAFVLAGSDGAANGNKAKKMLYDGKADDVAFSIELEPIPFQINAVQGRYRLVRIRMVNNGSTPLALSAQGDRVRAFTGAAEVEGILDLGQRDAPLWDGFPLEVRTMLAYPTVVKPREEESVFVFFDTNRVTRAPAGLLYTIASLKRDVSIMNRSATAAE